MGLNKILIAGFGSGEAKRPLHVGDQSADLNAVAIGSGATVITATAGKKVRLVAVELSVSAAASVLFETVTTGTDVYRTPVIPADTPFVQILGNGVGKLAADAESIKATSSAAANVTGTLWYCEE